MTRFSSARAFSALILAASLVATIVAAQPVAFSDPPTARVSYADLDLSKEGDRATFQSRLDHAVELVCGKRPITTQPDETALWIYCSDRARAGADQQLEALYRGGFDAEKSAALKTSR